MTRGHCKYIIFSVQYIYVNDNLCNIRFDFTIQIKFFLKIIKLVVVNATDNFLAVSTITS